MTLFPDHNPILAALKTASNTSLYHGHPHYSVTKRFFSGLLKGLETTEVTTVKFEEGFRCERPIGGSGYEIISCVRIAQL